MRFQRFKQLPPGEQARSRQMHERYRNLPPEKRQELRERWQNMPPDERARERERLERSPGHRRLVCGRPCVNAKNHEPGGTPETPREPGANAGRQRTRSGRGDAGQMHRRGGVRALTGTLIASVYRFLPRTSFAGYFFFVKRDLSAAASNRSMPSRSDRRTTNEHVGDFLFHRLKRLQMIESGAL